MNTVYLLIGGNIGNREGYLQAAKLEMSKAVGRISKQSALYQTEPWGLSDQPPFLNQALVVKTNLSAKEILKTILYIEQQIGRKRTIKNGPRTIDIDILFFNEEIINAENLTVPHPEMQNRRFVLAPLAEIAGSMLHPVLQKTIAELLEECPDELTVEKIS